jgi:hypothetical protein
MAKINIPIAKAGGQVEIDTDQVPEDLFRYIWSVGCKAVMNRGMTKVTKALVPNEDERKTAAMEIAQKNLEAIYAGKIRMTGGVKVKAATGEINTEAMRLARLAVKDTIKEAGGKVSHYDASEITKAAKDLITADPSIVEQATANIEARKAAKPKAAIDVSKIAVSAKKVAESEKKKAADKAKRDAKKAEKGETAPLSKTQAGKSAPRAVPGKKAQPKPVVHA